MYYIAYFSQGYPCEPPGEPQQFTSIKTTIEGFRDYAHATGRDYYDPYGTACAWVYAADSDQEWTEAERFAGIGCPFDYPSYVLSIGVRGGVKRERC